MADIDAIATGLAARLATISGMRTSSTVVDAVTPPMAVVGDVEIDFDQAFQRALDELRYKVRIYASRADDRSGQRALNAYLAGSGASSVKTAVELDRTLGGTAETCQVTGVRNYGAYDVGGTTYLGADVLVTVWARGS